MFSSTLWIRTARSEDCEAIYGIDQVCFPPDIAFSRADFLFWLHHPKSIARVAEMTDGIVGFVLARMENRSSAHVLTLDVVPGRRRCGIGTKLMNALHDELQTRAIASSVLEVGVQNIEAQGLYKRLGYEIQGLLPGYYRGREDAYQMKCEAFTRGRSQ